VAVTTVAMQLQAVRWADGTLLWAGTPSSRWRGLIPQPAAAVAAHPDTDDLALAAWNQPGQEHQESELWLITTHAARRVADHATFGII
jgi:hypothetical protein